MRYYFVSETRDAYENLATDEFFLNALGENDMMMYLYVNDPAVIFGRNQNPYAECNLNRLNADGVRPVRRVSGGGCVYHDLGNLNFSFICDKNIYDERRQTGIILDTLKRLGADAGVSGRNDIEIDGRKFSGNAYCSRGMNKQRHGTLLVDSDLTVFDKYLNAPAMKLAAKGVKSVRARVCNLSEYIDGLTVEKLSRALLDGYLTEFSCAREYAFSASDRNDISDILARVKSREWIFGETPAFDYSIENRFSWGMTQICLSVENGRITAARVFTDSLDASLPERLEPLFMGLEFDRLKIFEKLSAIEGEAAEIANYIRDGIE